MLLTMVANEKLEHLLRYRQCCGSIGAGMRGCYGSGYHPMLQIGEYVGGTESCGLVRALALGGSEAGYI